MPEIADGVVEIKACAREPGHRTKIAVWSNDNNVDPVGACVGARGARVRQVVNELRGEKIDIVPFSDDPYEFVAKALSPAKVKEVRINEDTGVAEVIVPDYQLSLAIGKEGQNARLSARLTGWRVDIKSESQLAEEETYGQQDWAEGEWVVDAETGEQVWQPAEGGPALKAEDWEAAVSEAPAEGEAVRGGDVRGRRGRPRPSAEAPPRMARRGGRRRAATAEDAASDGEARPRLRPRTCEAELDAEDEVAEDVAELTETERRGREARPRRASPPMASRARGSRPRAEPQPSATCVAAGARPASPSWSASCGALMELAVEGRTLPGRGAWLCRATLDACRALAVRRGAFARAFRDGRRRLAAH